MEQGLEEQVAKEGSPPERGRGASWRRRFRGVPPAAGYLVPPALALALLAIAWELWIRVADTPVYILPAPSAILRRLFGDLGYFASEGFVTLYEAMAGFGVGCAVALAAAILMAHSRFVEKSLFPLAILVKVTPIVAIAPLLVIWFGFGPVPKVFIAALLTFYPVLVNAVVGFRSVNPGALDFVRSLHASPWETFWLLRVPSSLPYLFAAFRIAVPLSVIGAVVAEWFSAEAGLGSVIIVAHYNLDMPTLFSAIITLAVIGIGLTVLTSAIERRLLFWHESSLAP